MTNGRAKSRKGVLLASGGLLNETGGHVEFQLQEQSLDRTKWISGSRKIISSGLMMMKKYIDSLSFDLIFG